MGELNTGHMDGLSYLPPNLQSGIVAPSSFNFYKLNLSQLTAIFFNQNKNESLKDKKVRSALNMAIDKNKIIDVLGGDYSIVSGPILPNNFAYSSVGEKNNYNLELAKQTLDEAGWKIKEIKENQQAEYSETATSSNKINQQEDDILGVGMWRAKTEKEKMNYLIVKLTTVDTAENAIVAEFIRNAWESIGVKTIIEFVPISKIQGDVIKNRDYEALFYGLVLETDPDPFAFWHSSQAGKYGLNLSLYSNKEVDKILEEARKNSDEKDRLEKYKKFQNIINEDIPAIFLYEPTYTYIQTKKIKGFDVKNILNPSDRFNNISSWYLTVGRRFVW